MKVIVCPKVCLPVVVETPQSRTYSQETHQTRNPSDDVDSYTPSEVETSARERKSGEGGEREKLSSLYPQVEMGGSA